MTAWLRREEWCEEDRLSAVDVWLSAVNEGTDQDVLDKSLFFFTFSEHLNIYINAN